MRLRDVDKFDADWVLGFPREHDSSIPRTIASWFFNSGFVRKGGSKGMYACMYVGLHAYRHMYVYMYIYIYIYI